MLKRDLIKKTLENIEKNNLELLKFKILKASIVTRDRKPKNSLFLQNDNYIGLETNAATLKVKVDTSKLLNNVINGAKNFSFSHVLSNQYITFEKTINSDFKKFLELFKMSNFLFKDQLIKNQNIIINEISVKKVTNEQVFKKDDTETEDKWWQDKMKLVSKIIEHEEFIKVKVNEKIDNDELALLVNELLIKGTHEIEIKYAELETTLTEKGYAYTKSTFWKRNRTWLLPFFISLFSILISFSSLISSLLKK